jgi:hypothetical protein
MRHPRVLMALLAAGFLSWAGLLAFVLAKTSDAVDRNETARVALCAFQADLERRADSGQEYLNDVRDGRRARIPGITIPDIQRSVSAQRSTLKTLRILDCGGTP